ncbi:MAG TPA: 50S ribosomal protein L3 [Smithella sp.]|jgi:large subunit ribosomal protein L3|nr:50S ribosomal protein L3 [Smithella sp.]OQC53977.1 MAG: 50S ribosomal protein L3 [Deltaproteobacteria bacterium ADurb.Bin022]HNQ64980.1 50S ribosomal protein L3 [Smithella sp.]HOE32822.1 50S ribosomal protein L3 [Smithella sp.]HOO35061.1 50S ribosomal protein L3 [Smithella sp.]
MSKGIIGKKLGMTQVFADDGSAVGVTAIEVEPSVVLQVKTKDKDGYDAVQLGYGRVKQKNVTRPLQGHFNKANKGFFRFVREFPAHSETYEVGQEISADIFAMGDYVDVVGTSKGKGFQGVVKRHGFGGGRATHGSMFHRAPGSIGASADPSRVFKGTKMGGHMGNVRKTVQNLKVWQVRSERNLLLLEGSVPGSRNSFLLITKAKKK